MLPLACGLDVVLFVPVLWVVRCLTSMCSCSPTQVQIGCLAASTVLCGRAYTQGSMVVVGTSSVESLVTGQYGESKSF